MKTKTKILIFLLVITLALIAGCQSRIPDMSEVRENVRHARDYLPIPTQSQIIEGGCGSVSPNSRDKCCMAALKGRPGATSHFDAATGQCKDESFGVITPTPINQDCVREGERQEYSYAPPFKEPKPCCQGLISHAENFRMPGGSVICVKPPQNKFTQQEAQEILKKAGCVWNTPESNNTDVKLFFENNYWVLDWAVGKPNCLSGICTLDTTNEKIEIQKPVNIANSEWHCGFLFENCKVTGEEVKNGEKCCIGYVEYSSIPGTIPAKCISQYDCGKFKNNDVCEAMILK